MFQKVTPAIAESWFQGKLLPDRRLAFGRKGPNAARPFAHPGLVDEDDGSAFSGAVFLVSADASSSNARSRLRLLPATARPLAGKVQFLDESPHIRFRIPLGADLRDELGPARQRPRIGGISLRQGAGFERFDQSILLGVGQPWRALGSAAPCATRRPSAIAYHDRFARSPQTPASSAKPRCG